MVNGVLAKIKEIVGKELTLNIRIKHDNVLLKSTVFFASNAYEPDVTSSVSIDASTFGATVSSINEISLPYNNELINDLHQKSFQSLNYAHI